MLSKIGVTICLLRDVANRARDCDGAFLAGLLIGHHGKICEVWCGSDAHEEAYILARAIEDWDRTIAWANAKEISRAACDGQFSHVLEALVILLVECRAVMGDRQTQAFTRVVDECHDEAIEDLREYLQPQIVQ